MKKLVSRKFFRTSLKLRPASKNSQDKKDKGKQSPSNSRTIPERISTSPKVFIFLICFFSGILLMVILLQENNIRQDIISLQALQNERMGLQRQILQWEHVVTIYPDYRDGYFHLAILEYQLGNMQTAQVYNQLALRLDPNFEQGKELQTKISNY